MAPHFLLLLYQRDREEEAREDAEKMDDEAGAAESKDFRHLRQREKKRPTKKQWRVAGGS